MFDTGSVDRRPGFFGKVTSHGDFVGRRLAPTFQQRWDDWAQQGLQASRQALGPQWLTTWLSSPIWRFALAPGVCGDAAWCGLQMPSVDRVGRHFPLMIAAPWPAGAPLLDCVTAHDAWFTALEDLALSSLRAEFSLDDFDAALCALVQPAGLAGAGAIAGAVGGAGALAGAPVPARAREARAGTFIALDAALPLSDQLDRPSVPLLQAIAGAALHGQSLWWTDGSPQIAPCVLVCAGMPSPTGFTALLDGDWQSHGWR
jgi:type VI secretion system protein ImpM